MQDQALTHLGSWLRGEKRNGVGYGLQPGAGPALFMLPVPVRVQRSQNSKFRSVLPGCYVMFVKVGRTYFA